MNSRKVIIGSVIGGAVGAVAVTLLTSKRTRKSFTDMVEECGDKIKSAVNGASNFDMSDVVAVIKDQIEDMPSFDNKDFLKGVVIGAVLGGVLGTGATMWMNGSGNADSCIRSVARQFSTLMDGAAQTATQASRATDNITSDILDFAHAGFKCWKKFAK